MVFHGGRKGGVRTLGDSQSVIGDAQALDFLFFPVYLVTVMCKVQYLH